MKKEQVSQELFENIEHQIGKPKEPLAVGYTVEEGIYVFGLMLPFKIKKVFGK